MLLRELRNEQMDRRIDKQSNKIHNYSSSSLEIFLNFKEIREGSIVKLYLKATKFIFFSLLKIFHNVFLLHMFSNRMKIILVLKNGYEVALKKYFPVIKFLRYTHVYFTIYFFKLPVFITSLKNRCYVVISLIYFHQFYNLLSL